MIVSVIEVGNINKAGTRIDYLKCKSPDGPIYILHNLRGMIGDSPDHRFYIPDKLSLNLDDCHIGDFTFFGMFFTYAEIHYKSETENVTDIEYKHNSENWKDRFMTMFTSMIVSGANANDFTFAIDWSKEMIIAENIGEIPGALLHEIDILYDKYVTKGGSKCQ